MTHEAVLVYRGLLLLKTEIYEADLSLFRGGVETVSNCSARQTQIFTIRFQDLRFQSPTQSSGGLNEFSSVLEISEKSFARESQQRLESKCAHTNSSVCAQEKFKGRASLARKNGFDGLFSNLNGKISSRPRLTIRGTRTWTTRVHNHQKDQGYFKEKEEETLGGSPRRRGASTDLKRSSDVERNRMEKGLNGLDYEEDTK